MKALFRFIATVIPLSLLALLLTVGGANASEPELVDALVTKTATDDLPAIRKRKQLRVLVTYSRTDFVFLDKGHLKGLQIELLNEYEKVLNRGIKNEVDKTQIVLVPTTFDRLLPDLIEGKGDVAAALLTITPEREKQVDFATGAAMMIDELVVAHKSLGGDIEKVEDLAGRELYVLRNSSYAEHLRDLNTGFKEKGLKPIRIKQADAHLLSEDIMEMVNAGVVPITVVDSYKAKLWAKVLPDIQVLEDVKVKANNSVGWAVRKNNPKLLKSLRAFTRKAGKGTLIGNTLFNRYFKNTRWIKNPAAEDERSKVRAVIEVFKKYADKYDFDVLALTAQAYQESKLDNGRRSHRGAVGIMQMLPSTAADPHVGIKDIHSLENNIHAGVKYLAFLRDHYFSDPQISAENRLAFSWAAYNAGPGKVRKMRKKAKTMGLDPNVWYGNVELAAAKIVGRETVRYVRNIFKYYIAYSLVQDRILNSPDKA